MTPERWRRLEELYDAVVDLSPAERSLRLKDVDSEMRLAVEVIFAQGGSPLDRPAWEGRESLLRSANAVTPGAQLGPYKIQLKIGEGGMGAVFRATDTRLGRSVALKTCREEFSERFQREARAIASLNHRHICSLYDVGPNYLVMELLEGETLATKLKAGKLTIDQTLLWGQQIADALTAAHDKGIVHRDLKPGNIMIAPGGDVKVLDFGLATIVQPSTTGSDDPRTATMSVTQPGTVIGTPGYMSPEQFAGQPVDERTDVWAYGVVMWEMLTGRRLFGGDSVQQIMSAVLSQEEPRWEEVPWKFRRLLHACLQRDLRNRLRSLGDAKLLIEEGPEPSPPSQVPGRKGVLLVGGAAIGAVLASAIFSYLLPPTRGSRPADVFPIRFDVELGTDLDCKGRVAISPDGNRIAFVGLDANGKGSLLTRRLDQPTAIVLDSDIGEGAQDAPFFSPDGRWIGYGGDHKLKKVSVDGGLPSVIAEGLVAGGQSIWGKNGDILSNLTFAGVSRIPSSGGEPRLIPVLDAGPAIPSFMPGEKAILFSFWQLSILPLDGGKAKPIAGIQGKWARYLPMGAILYIDPRSVLQALPFNETRLEAAGKPTPLLQNVESFDLSDSGTLLYRRGNSLLRTVQWVDAAGKTEPILKNPGTYAEPRISPDGKKLALTIRDDKGRQVWIHDLESGTTHRLTFEASNVNVPVWMPSGKYLLFKGSDGVYGIPTDGSGTARLILKTDGWPGDVSPDGHKLALTRDGKGTERDIWLIPLVGEGGDLRAGTPEPFVNGPGDEVYPSFSPDGKWLAYSSSETGSFTVYVRSLENPGAKWQVSAEEGYLPEWSRSEKSIIFHPIQAKKLRAVSYSVAGNTFLPGIVRSFGGEVEIPPNGPAAVYTVPPAGNRIIAVLNATGLEGARPRSNYTLILNFFQEIRIHSDRPAAR